MNDLLHPVVVLTALNVEHLAVREHLTDIRISQHSAGTVFYEGYLAGSRSPVVLAVAGQGNQAAAVLTERANSRYSPRALLFAGVAGGLHHDLRLGDIVVATRVYAYHGGKESAAGFQARPRSWDAAHELEQLARHLNVSGEWIRWLPADERASPPIVHFRPIASGEVVLNSRDSPLARQLQGNYNDAAAIEMESAGASHAGHLGSLPVLTIRGISDLADGDKDVADAGGSQPVAAAHAAAFAAALITMIGGAHFDSRTSGASDRDGKSTISATSVQSVFGQAGAPVFAVMHGDQIIHQARLAAEPDSARPDPAAIPPSQPATPEPGAAMTPLWRPVSAPAVMVWRSGIEVGAGPGLIAALELHLIPVGSDQRVQMRHLAALPGLLAMTGRERGVFSAAEPVHTAIVGEFALACSRDARRGPTGIAVGRSGQRSAWTAMPRDSLGAVLDPADVAGRLGDLLDLLTGYDLPPPELVAPAVGIEPAMVLSAGRVGDLPRSSARLGVSLPEKLRVEPEDMLTFNEVRGAPADVAEELAARLLHAFYTR